jgi:predicted transcriptional regulator
MSISDVVEKMIFLQKIKEGLKSIQRGDVVSHEEGMNKID